MPESQKHLSIMYANVYQKYPSSNPKRTKKYKRTWIRTVCQFWRLWRCVTMPNLSIFITRTKSNFAGLRMLSACLRRTFRTWTCPQQTWDDRRQFAIFVAPKGFMDVFLCIFSFFSFRGNLSSILECTSTLGVTCSVCHLCVCRYFWFGCMAKN